MRSYSSGEKSAERKSDQSSNNTDVDNNSAAVEAPFYGVGKLLDRAGLHTVYGNPVEQATVALGLGLLSILAWPLLTDVIRGLRLKAGGFAILRGLPARQEPRPRRASFRRDHLARVPVLPRRAAEETAHPGDRLFGFAYTVRYFDGAAAVMLVLSLLWRRRFRDAVAIAVTSACVCLLLFVIPWAYGVKVFSGGNYSAENVLVIAPLRCVSLGDAIQVAHLQVRPGIGDSLAASP